jgi:hypothetical protein
MMTISAETIRGADWRAYTGGTSEDEARETYATREGAQPAIVGFDQWGKVLAGPVSSADDTQAGR